MEEFKSRTAPVKGSSLEISSERERRVAMTMDLEEWVMGHETAQNMLRRIGPRTTAVAPLVPALQRTVNLHGRHVLEVAGASGSAKSEFLLQATVKCLLPKQGFGGWEGSVVWFDLDGHFDVMRLLRLLQAHIYQGEARQGHEEERGEQETEMEDGDQVLKACMERFYYTRCYSSLEFISALKSSRNQLLRAQSYGKASRILVVDSIAAFYWLDRSAPSKGGESTGKTTLSLQGVMQAVVRELKELRKLSHPTGLLVMVSKCNIYSSNFNDSNDWTGGIHKESVQVDSTHEKDFRRSGLQQQREFMPAVWQDFVTHRLVLKSQVADGNEALFTAEWLRPALLSVDKFTIHDAGFRLTAR